MEPPPQVEVTPQPQVEISNNFSKFQQMSGFYNSTTPVEPVITENEAAGIISVRRL